MCSKAVMSLRPKLLFVSPCTPDPLGTGWEQRSYAFLLAYSKIMDVELWFRPTWDNTDLARLHRLHGLSIRIHAYEPSVLRTKGSQMNLAFESAIAKADHLHLFRLPFAIKHKSLFWDIDELPGGAREGTAPWGRTAERVQKSVDDMQSFIEFAPLCTSVFASSPLENYPGMAATITIPNVVQRPVTNTPRASNSNTLLFVGNLTHMPNWDAIQFLLQDIARHLPQNLNLRIVGRSPLRAVDMAYLAAETEKGRVETFFDVEDCGPHYAACFAAVVPVRFGGGTRVKIVEAFAHQCPVISTSKGCEGLGVTDGQELLIRDDAHGFAEACGRLHADTQLRTDLTAKAFAHFELHNAQSALECQLFAALASKGVDFTPPPSL